MDERLATTDSVLRMIDREIWIVTAATKETRGGLCATWVSASSIDAERPVICIGLAPNHFTAELVAKSGGFGLHLMRPDQTETALGFAIGSGRDRDKFAELEWKSGATNSPLLADCLSRLECRVIAKYDAGDRIYFWGDVVASAKLGAGPCLRESQLIAVATDEQRIALKANRMSDVEMQRPLHEAWRLRNA